MLLHVNLLHIIGEKLKKPRKSINLEFSYKLSHRECYYIDSYLHSYLSKIDKYYSSWLHRHNWSGNKYSEEDNFKMFKFLSRRCLCAFNGENDNNDKALKWASGNGYFKIVKFLLQQNLESDSFLSFKKVNIHYEKFSSLKRASEMGHVKIVKILLKYSLLNHDDYHYYIRISLFIASMYSNIKVIKVLLQHIDSNDFFILNDCLSVACQYEKENIYQNKKTFRLLESYIRENLKRN